MRVEGMTKAEAITFIKDWPAAPANVARSDAADAEAEKLAFIKSIWTSAQPLSGSIAEQLPRRDPRHIDVDQAAGRHPSRVALPSGLRVRPGHLSAVPDRLDARPATDAPVGIQRIALERRNGCIEKIDRRMLGRAGVVKLWPARIDAGGRRRAGDRARRRHPDPVSGRAAAAGLGGAVVKQLAAIAGDSRRRAPDHPGRQRQQSGRADRGGTSATRWRAAGRIVVPLMPETPDTDFNDLVIRRHGRAEMSRHREERSPTPARRRRHARRLLCLSAMHVLHLHAVARDLAGGSVNAHLPALPGRRERPAQAQNGKQVTAAYGVAR